MKRILFILLTIAAYRNTSFAQARDIYVSPNGLGLGFGTDTFSAVSLARARVIAKSANYKNVPCHIWLMDGVYSYLALDSTDTRTATAPLTYHSLNKWKAVFQPITSIHPTDFKPLPDSVKQRIVDTVARKKVRQVSLASYNLNNMTPWPKVFEYPVSISATTTNRQQWPIVYFNSTPLPMSRYPNNDVMHVKQILTKGSSNSVPGGSFKYRDNRVQYWSKAIKDGLYLRGTWRVDWQMSFIKTDSISLKDTIIYQSQGVQGGIGNKYAGPSGNGAEAYIAVNLLEEIDTVGEWAINFNTKTLYVYPPDSNAMFISSNSSTPTIYLNNVQYTNFEGIKLDGGSSDGVRLYKCQHVSVKGMDISHISGYGVFIAEGNNCMVRSNDIHEVGQGGVFIINSNFTNDQLVLKACNDSIINNHIYNYAKDVYLYSAAIDTRSAIGTYSAYNTIHGCEHVGVLYGGNNNHFEYNDISDVVQTYTDMGAFYCAEFISERGNRIENNYIHAMNYKGSGLYTDNGSSGNYLNQNISAQCLLGAQNNFGYSNHFNNNIYYDNYRLHHTNSTSFLPDTNKTLLTSYTKLKTLYHASAIYKQAYPELADWFDTANSAYTSMLWPETRGCVMIGASVKGQCLYQTQDSKLFNANGTTNNTYAKTNVPFKSDGLVFQNNLLMPKSSFKTGKTNFLDSLKTTGVFGLTGNTNWHIDRIGLFKDSIYRSDISQTQTPGVAPSFHLQIIAKNGFVHQDTLQVVLTIKNPNIAHCYSSIELLDNNSTGVSLAVTTSSFDSIVLTGQWNNPSIGKHVVVAQLKDSLWWTFNSDSVVFSIKAPLAVHLIRFEGKPIGCAALLNWKVATEVSGEGYVLEQSYDSKVWKDVQHILSDGSNNYEVVVPQNSVTALYRLRLLNEKEPSYSRIVMVNTTCSTKQIWNLEPNPIHQGNMLRIYLAYSGEEVSSNVVVRNIEGNVVLRMPVLVRKGENQFKISTDKLAKGIYWVDIEG